METVAINSGHFIPRHLCFANTVRRSDMNRLIDSVHLNT